MVLLGAKDENELLSLRVNFFRSTKKGQFHRGNMKSYAGLASIFPTLQEAKQGKASYQLSSQPGKNPEKPRKPRKT